MCSGLNYRLLAASCKGMDGVLSMKVTVWMGLIHQKSEIKSSGDLLYIIQ